MSCKRNIEKLQEILLRINHWDDDRTSEIIRLINKIKKYKYDQIKMHLYNKTIDLGSEDSIFTESYILLFGEMPNKDYFIENYGSEREWQDQQYLYDNSNYDKYFELFDYINS